jgi:DNA-binding MarR family transcriptional regulator
LINSAFDPNYQELSIESRVVVGLERISAAFKTMLWNENKKYNLSPIQLQILTFLLFHPDDLRTISHLAKEFNTTKSSISDSVKTLEKKKYISREKKKADFRISTINLTEAGKETAIDVSSFSNKIEGIIAGLSETKKEILLESLIEIIHKLFLEGLISIQRMCLTCKYYIKDPGGNTMICSVLNEEVKISDLRIDCNEYD